MRVELYHCSEELKKLARREKDVRLAVRIRAVCLALDGKDAAGIAGTLGYSRRAVQNWIRAYNRKGLEGLRDEDGRGIKARLNADQLQWLRQRIDDGPTEEDGVCVFHASDVRRIIESQFSINYSLRQTQRLLRQMGYRYMSGRPEHPKGDPEARETFKKKLLLRSETSVLYILERE
jgi:transposase